MPEGQAMKLCDNCDRMNTDDAEKCLGCGGTEFTPLLPAPYWDSREEYP